MGCMGSKPVDVVDKEALQRNAKIDKILKNDKKTMDRTIKILLLGMCSILSPASSTWLDLVLRSSSIN